MSNIKELIREKIDAFYTEYKAKFHQNGDSYHLGIIDGLDMAERILDTLDEPVTDCHDLEEAAHEYAWEKQEHHIDFDGDEYLDYGPRYDAFKAGAEWQARQLLKSSPLPEDTAIFQKGVEEGKRLMMEGATYNELMELYRAIRDKLVKRHRDVPINIKEEQ